MQWVSLKNLLIPSPVLCTFGFKGLLYDPLFWPAFQHFKTNTDKANSKNQLLFDTDTRVWQTSIRKHLNQTEYCVQKYI